MFRKVCFIAAALIGFSWAGFGQSPSFTSVYASSDSGCFFSMDHIVTINGNVTNYSSNTQLNIYWGDGSSSLNDTLTSFGNFYSSHNYPTVGTYTVSVVLLEGTVPVDTNALSVQAFCHELAGYAYKRNDNNCTMDTGEADITTPLRIQVLKAGVPVDTINFSESYVKGMDSADLNSVFTLQLLDTPLGTTLACPTTPYTFKFDTLTSNDRFNYAFDCDPNYTGYDLSVTGWAHYKTATTSYLNILARNASCAGQDATITLHLSPKYSFDYCGIPPTSTSGNTITWQYNDLSNSHWADFFVGITPALSDSLMGDTAMSYVTITPTNGDVDTVNNHLDLVDSIRASFDPNGKSATPYKTFSAGQALTYTIYFENTGTAPAVNIHILDTLSSHLDVTTLKVLATSHHMSYHVYHAGNREVIKFEFANIMLPDSSNGAEAAQGFVTYQINSKANLTPGTVIHNSADIYFDANAPVPTNVTTNVIPTGEGIQLVSTANRLKVVPNPAHDQLYILGLHKIKKIAVFNILGQKVTIPTPESGMKVINISHLPAGVYFLKVVGQDRLYSQKFVKQ